MYWQYGMTRSKKQAGQRLSVQMSQQLFSFLSLTREYRYVRCCGRQSKDASRFASQTLTTVSCFD